MHACMCVPVTLSDELAPAGKPHQNEQSLDDNIECEDSECPVGQVDEPLRPVLVDDATVDEYTSKEDSRDNAVDNIHDRCATSLQQRILFTGVETFATRK